MKNALGATLVTLALVGCTSAPTGKVTQENTSGSNAAETQVNRTGFVGDFFI